MGKDEVKGDGHPLNRFNRQSGFRNRRCGRESKFHLAPKCPLRGVARCGFVPRSPVNRKDRRPFFSTISMDAPVSARGPSQSGKEGGGSGVEDPNWPLRIREPRCCLGKRIA